MRYPILGLGIILTILFIAGIAGYRIQGAPEQALLPWGTMVVGYTFFALASGGVFDSMAIRLLREGRGLGGDVIGALAWSSLALLIPGVILVFSDILHPGKSYHFYLSFNPESRIAWNAVLYTLYGLGVIAFIVYTMIMGKGVNTTSKRIALATLFFSLLLEANLGMAYGVNIAVPAWYTAMAPILFISASLVLGSAFTILTLRLEGKQIIKDYIEELRYAILATLFIIGWSLVSMSGWGDAKETALRILTRLPEAGFFWIGYILVGVVTPLILSNRTKTIAALAAIIGVALYLVVPFNYIPQETRLEVNPFYNLLSEASGIHVELTSYILSYETLAFIGGAGVWLIIQILRVRVIQSTLLE